ncbi:MAG: hypothetical protein ABFD69_11225 [Candidatus Sumerlaeia bacterium]
MGRNIWRRCLWVGLGVFVGVPIAVMIILSIVFRVNAIRPDQAQPPRGLIKTAAATPGDHQTTGTLGWMPAKPPANFEALIAASPNKEYAELYTKLMTQEIYKKWQKGGFDRWRGEPLTPEQAQWLINHRGLIDDLLRLAKAGGYPLMTVEQMMTLDPWDAFRWPMPNYLEIQTFGRILSAEAMRRFAAGDQAGAAEALLAIGPIARSTSEPFLISHLIGIAMQQVAAREVSRWLESGELSPSTARSLGGQLATNPIDLNNYRRAMELEYYNTRGVMTLMMQGSLGRIVQMSMQGNTNESFLPYLYRGLTTHPITTARELAHSTAMGIVLKADASQTLENFDSNYQKMFDAMDRNEIVDPNSLTRRNWFDPIPNFMEAQTRTNASLAVLELDIAGLNLLAGQPTVEQQDRFIEQPLKTVQEADATLIYSVGPDRQDQRAEITYDPTNGTMSAGDIWIRVKKR